MTDFDLDNDYDCKRMELREAADTCGAGALLTDTLKDACFNVNGWGPYGGASRGSLANLLDNSVTIYNSDGSVHT